LFATLCEHSLRAVAAPAAERLLGMAGQVPLFSDRLLVVSEFPQDTVDMPEVEVRVVKLRVKPGRLRFFARKVFILEKVDP
jgi:hypothetical protein